MSLFRDLARLAIRMKYSEESNPTISSAPVGWHIDHTLKVINYIYDELESSDTANYSPSPNPVLEYVLKKKKIERGRVHSSKEVMPPENITAEELITQLEEAKIKVIKIRMLEENQFITHHMLGQMKRAQAVKFLKIHTRHHLEIIEDILRENLKSLAMTHPGTELSDLNTGTKKAINTAV